MNRKRVARELLTLAKELIGAGWPSSVQHGKLRDALGLSEDKPLEDQTSAAAVAKFFKKADKAGRGMVMFAINSNKDSKFWKAVHNAIK